MTVETKVISAAMRELAQTIQCADGVANAACAQSAERLDAQADEITQLRQQLENASGRSEYWKQNHLAGNAEIDQLRQQLANAQSKIDSLMLEYCPDEMTPAQKSEWAEHQVPFHNVADNPFSNVSFQSEAGEAVAWMHSDHLDNCDVAIPVKFMVQSKPWNERSVPLYTHPAPVVPEAMEWNQLGGRDHKRYSDGWNACREAMLEAQENPAPVVPDDKYKAMLIKKLDLIRCGVATNYGSGSYEHPLYTEVVELLSAAQEKAE